MNDILAFLAQQSARPEAIVGEPAAAAGKPPAGGTFEQMLPMLGIFGLFAVFMFFMNRSQRKEDKRKKEMMASLKKGDQVVTTAGIIGTVSSIKNDTVILNVGGTKVEFLSSAIGSMRSPARADKAEKE